MGDQGLIGGCLTPSGEGGLLVFRVEGDAVPGLLARIFRPQRPGASPRASLRYGHLVDGSEVVDEVLLVTEDAGRKAEISTHGGFGTQAAVEDLLVRRGVRLVDPESIADGMRPPRVGRAIDREARRGLSRAGAVQAMLFYLEALEGRLATEVAAVRDALRQRPKDAAVMGSLAGRLDTLIGRAPFGRAFQRPPSLVLLGPPNAGKSSLSNRLLGADRCIVTEEPGTTRDLIDQELSLEGYPFRLIDCAGVRSRAGTLERAGVERSLAAARDADLVLVLLDGAERLTEEPELDRWLTDPRALVALNKSDLPRVLDPARLAAELRRPVFAVSAREGDGVASLVEAVLFRSPFRGPATRELACPFTSRQDELLRVARDELDRHADAAAALDAFLEEPA